METQRMQGQEHRRGEQTVVVTRQGPGVWEAGQQRPERHLPAQHGGEGPGPGLRPCWSARAGLVSLAATSHMGL